VVISITLLAGFVPLLQVTFFALLEGFSIRVARCERSGQTFSPYHVVSDYWVDHGEFVLIDRI